MSRAIGTFGDGAYVELLAYSRPLFQAYATRHGYTYCEQEVIARPERPPSWWRLPILYQMLEKHGEVLWFGCDVVIVDGTQDIADSVPHDAWAAMVAHEVAGEIVPNMDVMLLRRPLAPYLRKAWEMTQYINHPWWEQAAWLHLMGYDMTNRPYRMKIPTELYERTHFLPLEWNSHESSQRHEHPRFAHATYGPLEWRKTVMAQRVNEAVWA